MWVYKSTGPGLWTVGFYDPNGKWYADSDYSYADQAAYRVITLNGGFAIKGGCKCDVPQS